jgi:hypothetical protein
MEGLLLDGIKGWLAEEVSHFYPGVFLQ